MRNETIDILKYFAAFGVVAMHIVDLLIFPISEGVILIESLARFAVPFFFIVSMYFITEKSYINSISKFDKQKLSIQLNTLLRTYIFWLIVSLFSRDILNYILFQGPKIVINSEVFYYGFGVLWYLISFVWSGWILFCISKIFNDKVILLFSLVLFTLSLFGSGQVFSKTHIITRDAVFFALPFTSLGYIISKYKKYIIPYTKKYIVVILFSIVSLLILNYFQLSNIYLKFPNKHTDIMPVMIFCSTLIFCLCISYPVINFIPKHFQSVGSKSLYIYLFHMIFVAILRIYLNNNYVARLKLGNNFILFLFVTAVIFYCSFGLRFVYIKMLGFFIK